ncbi:MAG TPA: hypothetical protein VL443_03530 [Cyclobacteriaceae bacterium]|nr:hypothetical protein [Cyclobacteriaceae bacterium]
MEISIYAPVWNKYRPVLLKLMTDSAVGPQEYKMFVHEFKAMGEKVKSGYSFTLEASKGKALNNIKNSIIANDLLSMLQQSNKAMELMSDAIYELSMDKKFVLHVNRKPIPVPAEPVAAE